MIPKSTALRDILSVPLNVDRRRIFGNISFSDILVFAIPIALTLTLTGVTELLVGLQQIIVAVIATLGCCLFLVWVAYRKVPRRTQAVIAAGLAFILITVVGIVLADGELSRVDWKYVAKHAAQIGLSIGWLAYATEAPWDKSGFWATLIAINLPIILVNLALWAAGGFEPQFGGIAGPKNALGALGFFGVFIGAGGWLCCNHSLLRRASVAQGAISLCVLYASGNRSALIALAVAGAIYLIWPLLNRSKYATLPIFGIVVIVSAYLPVSYEILDTSVGQRVNSFFISVFQSNLKSGRNELWPMTLTEIERAPMLGAGSHGEDRFTLKRYLNREKVVDVEFSAHNYYLDTLFRGGVLKMSALLFFISVVWIAILQTRGHVLSRLVFCFFVGFLLRENFEVNLTHNNLIVGLGIWSVVGCGISRVTGGSRANQTIERYDYSEQVEYLS